jgi:hypothetical protein
MIVRTYNPTSQWYPGLGQTNLQDAQTAEGIAATGIAVTTSILTSMGTTLTVLGVTLSATVVGAAIVGLLAVGLAIAECFKGCGITCTQATAYANQAGAILAKNVDAYTSSSIRYASMQAAALNTFDTAWAALQAACNNPQLAAAGQRCITDRQQGACHWKASPGGWNSDGTYTPWGPSGSGTACWNWFIGMRDPIANDPFVQPDPVAGASSSTTGATTAIGASSSTAATTDYTPLLIGAAILAAVALL